MPLLVFILDRWCFLENKRISEVCSLEWTASYRRIKFRNLPLNHFKKRCYQSVDQDHFCHILLCHNYLITFCRDILKMDSSCQKRLTKEYQQLTLEPPAGVHVKDESTRDLRLWIVHVDGAPNTLYAGEQFTLRVIFFLKSANGVFFAIIISFCFKKYGLENS